MDEDETLLNEYKSQIEFFENNYVKENFKSYKNY